LPVGVKLARGTLRPSRERDRPKARTRSESLPKVPARDYAAIATMYADDVLHGRLVAGQWARLAVQRQQRDRRRAADDVTWPYVWSDAHASDVCRFLERLPHVEGTWTTPTITLEPWQVFVVSTLFGWRSRDDLARRRFTTCYLEVARKAAKSTIAAGLALFHLLREREPGASVICGATTGAQARIVFSIMQRMIRRAAWLQDAGLAVFANAITFDAIGGSARPVNAKSQTLDGLNPSCIVLDESHAQSFGLHDVLKSAQGSRQNPLLLAPTTAGYDLLSVGYALRQTVQKVLQNVVANDHTFGIIYALDEGDDWREEATWRKANPSLGVTPTLEWIRRYAKDAEQTPGLQGEFRVKCCSEWLHSASAWLSMPAWDACADRTLTLEAFAGAPCWIGCDLASRDDLAAVAFVFEREGLLYGFVRCYLPELVVHERAREIPEYAVWAERRLLVLTDGDLTDHTRIETDIRAACKTYDVQDIAFDQYGSIQISGALSNDGLPARVEAKNAKTFTGPSKELEARITRGKFRHDGNSLLKWAASNCVVSRRVDDSLLPKKVTGESAHKIDPIDALLLAMGGWLRRPTARESVYLRREVLVF
jgi:phage terminase large subunit-like protein